MVEAESNPCRKVDTVEVSPPGSHHQGSQQLVVITDDGGCSGCIYKRALAYLLDHATGTGELTLNEEELLELGTPHIELLQLRFKKEGQS